MRNGFLPRAAPRLFLPSEFRAWDEAAASLPQLYSSLELRRHIEGLPVLDAAGLPDADLPRAATVLSILAHAYRQIRIGSRRRIPRALSTPWRSVCQRLGRPGAIMTYDDLILRNWRWREPAERGSHEHVRLGSLRASALQLLVPTVGTEEERIFYLAQLEVTACLAPALPAYLKAVEGLRARDWALVEGALADLCKAVKRALLEGFGQLTTAEASPRRLRPLIWARTVAPLAVMEGGHLPGPSGTSNPALQLLDEILGRSRYESELGRESLRLRPLYPARWRSLFSVLHGRAGLQEPIVETRVEVLNEAWNELVRLYSGPNGILATHRRKVFGFLELAFKVGRELTIGGFAGALVDRAWVRVDDALEASARERDGMAPPPLPEPTGLAIAARSSGSTLEAWAAPQFYRQALKSRSPVLRLGTTVVALESLMSLHPGGSESLRLYVGRDAQAAFRRLGHDGASAVHQLLQSASVGKIVCPLAKRPWHRRLVGLIEHLFEVLQAFALEYQLFEEPLTSNEAPRGSDQARAVSPLALMHAAQALRRLRKSWLESSVWHSFLGELQQILGAEASAPLASAYLSTALREAPALNRRNLLRLRNTHRSLQAALRFLLAELVRVLEAGESRGVPARSDWSRCASRVAFCLNLPARLLLSGTGSSPPVEDGSRDRWAAASRKVVHDDRPSLTEGGPSEPSGTR